ncbi:hypothetical protein E2C01_085807 [Portunus trituberculatus]|uniref:Uncharacterized protein n=1 Tax=Portunus trituberculatus TaxID=210409 RepID=A0A5B7J9V9_PORTR|nr:hypothetical protein [Portunus trituberculatus]
MGADKQPLHQPGSVTRCAELRVRRELVYTGGALRGHSKPLWSENTPSDIRTHTQSSGAIGAQERVGHVIGKNSNNSPTPPPDSLYIKIKEDIGKKH